METEYIYLPKSTFDAMELNQGHILDERDIVILNVHKKVLAKFVDQKAVALQFDIWSWAKKWEEGLYLKIVDTLHEIATDIRNMDEVFNKYKAQQEEEERQRLEKEEED